jgi:transposase
MNFQQIMAYAFLGVAIWAGLSKRKTLQNPLSKEEMEAIEKEAEREFIPKYIPGSFKKGESKYKSLVTKFHKQGLTQGEIANKLGLSQHSVSDIMKRISLKALPKGRPGVSDEIKKEIIKLYKEGTKGTEIAKKLNIKHGVVYKVILEARNKMKLPIRNPKKATVHRLTQFREKNYVAWIAWKDGTSTKTKAWREGKGTWMVGGDIAKATTDLGGKIFIHINGRIYWLKGNRLIFQDMENV